MGFQTGNGYIIQKTGVRYHEVHIYRLLHKWGFKSKVPQKRFVNTASKKNKRKFKKSKTHSSQFKIRLELVVQDESIFVYDYVIKRKKWISADKRRPNSNSNWIKQGKQ